MINLPQFGKRRTDPALAAQRAHYADLKRLCDLLTPQVLRASAELANVEMEMESLEAYFAAVDKSLLANRVWCRT